MPVCFPAFSSLGCLLYLATTLAYSIYLKRVALVDVLVLSGLYTLRLLAGGAATQTPISHWLAGFSMFLFLSLAFVKRFAELENLRVQRLCPRKTAAAICSLIWSNCAALEPPAPMRRW